MQTPVSTPQSSHRDLPVLNSEYLDCRKPELFELGHTVCTYSVQQWAKDNMPDELLENQLWLNILIHAHNTGCWHELDENDRKQNYAALEVGSEGRIFSAYTLLGERIYVITECDRSATTVLLASDY